MIKLPKQTGLFTVKRSGEIRSKNKANNACFEPIAFQQVSQSGMENPTRLQIKLDTQITSAGCSLGTNKSE